MGTKYSSQSATGYNASPPPDDGTTVASNKITWQSTIKAKLADPLKTLADAINTALVTALNLSCRTISANDSTVASDHWRTMQVTGTTTVSLGDAATMASGYMVTVYNAGTGTVTVSRANAADTIDGTAADTTIAAKDAKTFLVNAAQNGYNTVSAATRSSSSGSALLPGDIVPSGASTRAGALLCDGSAVSRTTYAALFAAISTAYGVGDGSSTFNVPDFRGRTPIGAGTGSGLTARSLGQTGGEETHLNTANESGTTAHTHTVSGTASFTVASAVATTGGTTAVTTTDPTGSINLSGTLTGLSANASTAASAASAHNNMQPFGVVNYFIVY